MAYAADGCKVAWPTWAAGEADPHRIVTIVRPMRTLTVLAAIACLINTAAMGLGALARDPVTFAITYLSASGTGYVWLALQEGTRHVMTFREIAMRLRWRIADASLRTRRTNRR